MDHLISMQRAILEMIATGRPLDEVLEKICLLVEAQETPGVCSIMLLDEDGARLRTRSAPSLPPEATAALDGLAVANLSGSCGTAAYTGEIVIVEDTSADPRWAAPSLQDFARRFRVKACWSRPFFDQGGTVLGTFAISQAETGAPGAADLRLLETAAHLAGIAVERALTDAALRAALVELTDQTKELERELTERKRVEGQLVQAQKMESIGLLAGGVAHDLNNVLTVINGYAELLLRGGGADKQNEWLSEIRRSGERGAALTQRLLAFARKQALSPTVLDVNAVLRDLEPRLKALFGDAISLELRSDPDIETVHADQSQVQQALLNICANARDATPPGGHIRIETGRALVAPADGAAADDLEPGAYVTIRVTDDGQGMDDAVLARIFEPFFTTKDFGAGTGLGLSTAYGFARQSGGILTVESERGVGSAFTLYLPYPPRPSTAPAP